LAKNILGRINHYFFVDTMSARAADQGWSDCGFVDTMSAKP